MIDRLHGVLPHLEQLPSEVQEEIAEYIEGLLGDLEREEAEGNHNGQTLPMMASAKPWHDPVGSWQDLPDTMLEELDHLRHASPPTPPIALL